MGKIGKPMQRQMHEVIPTLSRFMLSMPTSNKYEWKRINYIYTSYPAAWLYLLHLDIDFPIRLLAKYNYPTLYIPSKYPQPLIHKDPSDKLDNISQYKHIQTAKVLKYDLKNDTHDISTTNNSVREAVSTKDLLTWIKIVGSEMATFGNLSLKQGLNLAQDLRTKGFYFYLDAVSEDIGSAFAIFHPADTNTAGLYWGVTSKELQGQGKFTVLLKNSISMFYAKFPKVTRLVTQAIPTSCGILAKMNFKEEKKYLHIFIPMNS